MRYMIVVKATKDSEAGVLLDGSGLQATSRGWRVRYRGANRTVVDCPFAETKELIAGYTIINVKSRAEALERFRELGMSGAEKLT